VGSEELYVVVSNISCICPRYLGLPICHVFTFASAYSFAIDGLVLSLAFVVLLVCRSDSSLTFVSTDENEALPCLPN
jgi:hypothetical protein